MSSGKILSFAVTLNLTFHFLERRFTLSPLSDLYFRISRLIISWKYPLSPVFPPKAVSKLYQYLIHALRCRGVWDLINNQKKITARFLASLDQQNRLRDQNNWQSYKLISFYDAFIKKVLKNNSRFHFWISTPGSLGSTL